MFFNSEPVPTLTFTIVEPVPEDRSGWCVLFQRGASEPRTFLRDCSHFTTVAQMVAEGLRRLEAEGADMVVHDPSGAWEWWLDHNRIGLSCPKRGIPTHSISD